MATTDSAPAPEPAATKVVKKSSAAKKPKSLPSHPPFHSMITEAIGTLKERNGSSQYAITKFIEEKHKKLPSNFRKMVLNRLKNLVASGKLVKVKASFKISSASPAAAVAKPKSKKAPSSKSVPAATKPKAAAKSKAAGKRKAAGEKPKPVKAAKTAAKSTPGKKKAVVKPKKAAAKKPKSVKSPARKKAAVAKK